jgi:hypothetical protein
MLGCGPLDLRRACAIKLMTGKVMADVMSKRGCKLRLVLHPQQQPCPDLHHSIGAIVALKNRVRTT